MVNQSRKEHWEKIYSTKEMNEVSWFQPIPKLSLNFIKSLNINKNAKIIDIGGGDSFLVDNLIELGFTDITVLDISEEAIKKAQKRLGDKADSVKWIVDDAAKFIPVEKYDLWHDRAAFHFLTQDHEIGHYVNNINNHINSGGKLIIGTFSTEGPLKCSGLEIKQYSEKSLKEKVGQNFSQIESVLTNHETPFNSEQEFVFSVFKKN